MRQHGISLEDAIRMGGRKGNSTERAKAAKAAALAAIPLPDVPLKPCANDSDYYVTEDGRVWNDNSKRWVAVFPHTPNPGKPHKKYLRVRLGGRECYVQTVVAQAWIENPANLPWVWHKDGDLLNNHKDNLVWATVREAHAYRKELKGSK